MHIIKNKKILLIIAGIIVLVSLGIVAKFGLQPGIDFTGGLRLPLR